jgi:hypothetical protein
MNTVAPSEAAASEAVAEDHASLAERRSGGLALERNPVRAVHNDELSTYLTSLGILGPQGLRIGCKFCGENVTVEHVATVFPLGGSIKIACDKTTCQADLLEAIRLREVRL